MPKLHRAYRKLSPLSQEADLAVASVDKSPESTNPCPCGGNTPEQMFNSPELL